MRTRDDSFYSSNTIRTGEIPEDGGIYGEYFPAMKDAMEEFLDYICEIREVMTSELGIDPVDHCLARIKSDASMRDKCRRRGLPETADSALHKVRDAIGIRIVCSFLSDIYEIRNRLLDFEALELAYEKDYIRHAKENGYRSYHMIVKMRDTFFVEIQLRTISMDTWAALEHQMKYKKHATANDSLIEKELKRCADELASTDVSMQTIRDMINAEASEQ